MDVNEIKINGKLSLLDETIEPETRQFNFTFHECMLGHTRQYTYQITITLNKATSGAS